MDDKINVCGAPIIFSTAPPPPHNPLHRPTVSYRRPIVALLLYAALLTLVLVVWPPDWAVRRYVAAIAVSAVYLLAIGRRAVIWCVHLYQSKASDKTRLRCVFEPSCSEYMILAVNQYGVVRGVCKGVRRLLRCHPPHGGADYP